MPVVGSPLTSFQGKRWTASPELVEEEISRVAQLKVFEYESHKICGGVLVVIGVIGHTRKYGGSESLRVRIEYPYGFPDVPPTVFDHDKKFEPGANGHQFSNSSLCLQFPEREEFSKCSTLATSQVLEASLNWLVKRNIFERTSKWPGDAERHGYAIPYQRLVYEHALQLGNGLLQNWTGWAIQRRRVPNLDADCPCLSGKPLKACHARLGYLVEKAIFHTIREEKLYGRR